MKKNEESGFILMLVILLMIALFVIGFAVYRIVTANGLTESVNNTSQQINS